MTGFIEDPAFWVGVAFVLFCALAVFGFKVHTLVANALTDRATSIRNELDDARALREEAQALLASYQRRQREAEQEAESIITQANAEAARAAEQAKEDLTAAAARATEAARDKIAQAESAALQEVRDAAIEVAIAAAQAILREKLDADQAAAFIDGSIADLRANLN